MDKDEFKALYNSYSPLVFTYARARAKSREDAKDILQEVFVDLWRAIEAERFAYTSEGEFRSFLYTLTRRRISKFYRAARLTISLDDTADFAESLPELERGEAALLLNGIEVLSNEDREVIKLRYFSGLTFLEIARLLNKGESAVKVRHHRAVEKLKKILKYEEPE